MASQRVKTTFGRGVLTTSGPLFFSRSPPPITAIRGLISCRHPFPGWQFRFGNDALNGFFSGSGAAAVLAVGQEVLLRASGRLGATGTATLKDMRVRGDFSRTRMTGQLAVPDSDRPAIRPPSRPTDTLSERQAIRPTDQLSDRQVIGLAGYPTDKLSDRPAI